MSVGRILLVAVLLVFTGRVALTWRVFNDTVDENQHLRAGLEILQKGRYSVEAQHPPLARAVLAVLPYLGGLRVDDRNELWRGGTWAHSDAGFYWKTLALARAGNLVFAGVLFFFVYQWGSRLWGATGGVTACLLASCSPALIAHSSLATLDLAAAATTVMAAYSLWRWSQQTGWRWCLASAGAFTLAVLAKFSALFVLPPLGALYFLAARRREKLRRGAAFAAVVFAGVWAAYGFQVGTITPPGHRHVQYSSPFSMGGPRSAPTLLARGIGTRPVPAPRFAQGVIDVLSHAQAGHGAYLLGRWSPQGFWSYFPVALAVKSTLPMLLLVTISIGLLAAGRYGGRARGVGFVLLAILVALGVAVASRLNIGIRHVLVIYPLFAILAAGLFTCGGRTLRVVAIALAAWHAAESIAAHPDYLAYFNQVARGREEQFLLDSNLDWGQDLARLGRYQQERKIGPVRLVYFGWTDPAKMGVSTRVSPHSHTAEGWFAISLNALFGMTHATDGYAWLREHKPVARVGKSIWVYYLPER